MCLVRLMWTGFQLSETKMVSLWKYYHREGNCGATVIYNTIWSVMDIRPHKEIKESRAVDFWKKLIIKKLWMFWKSFLKVDKVIYAVGLETVKVSEKCLIWCLED